MTDPTPNERLEGGVASLRVPEPRTDRESLLLRLGAAVVAVGIALIIFGWYGASGTRDVSEQVPYLISGGILGLSLVIVGAGLVMRFSVARLLRYWLARLAAEHQIQTDRVVAALDSSTDR